MNHPNDIFDNCPFESLYIETPKIYKISYTEIPSYKVIQHIKANTEIYIKGKFNTFKAVSSIKDLCSDIFYIKTVKEVRKINNIIVPLPVTADQLVEGDTYYVASLNRPDNYFSITFTKGKDTIKTYVSRGLLYNTSSDAKCYIKALLNYQ